MFNTDALKYGLGIRRRIITFFVVIVFISLFPIILIDRWWLTSFYERSETSFLTQTQKTLQVMLGVRRAHLEHLIEHYAHYPDILGFFGDILPGDPYLDTAFFLEPGGRIARADGEKGCFLEKDGSFDRRLFKILSDSGSVSGFWLCNNGRFCLLASARVKGKSNAGPRAGILVFAVQVNERFLGEISSLLNSGIDFFNIATLADPVRLKKIGAEQKASLETSRKELVYSQNPFLIRKLRGAKGLEVHYLDVLLRDITGDEIGLVRIRNVTAQSLPWGGFVSFLIGLILFVSLACILIMSRFLTLRITAPLVRLRDAIRDITSTRSLSRRLEVQSEDEVGGLILEFNNMLEEIEQTNQKIKRANDEALVLYKDLLDQKKFISEVLSLAPTIVLVLLPDGRIKFANEALEAVMGYKTEEVIGRNWLEDFLPFENKQEIRAVFNEIVKGNIAPYQQKENKVMTKKGALRTILWSNSLLKDKQGRVTAVISIGQDITEHKVVESELMTKVNELERFYKVTMDREKVILQLKEKIRTLEEGKKG